MIATAMQPVKSPSLKYSPERWRSLLGEIEHLLEMPAADQESRLCDIQASDPQLALELRDLLQRHQAMDEEFLEELPAIDAPAQLYAHKAGERVGSYELLRPLGRGGMGEVWLARRDDGTLEREVALKLPHAQLLSDHLRQRFRRERNILAALNHSNIGALYDAGVSDRGVPFLAMEWIDGVPVTDNCRSQSMSVADRIDLFQQVLEAVHYAHARLIAHRDLKPSNILVTRSGVIKLLDFGIAKLLRDDPLGDDSALTQFAGLVATPDYAAPEQLAGQPVTTAADVYALGVVLFELLTGVRPFAATSAHGPRPIDPPRASSCVTEEVAAELGRSNLRSVRRLLRGDLDAILATTLDPDPARRYRSAADFAQDLRRYRSNLPIAARRIGFGARIIKLSRRYRLAFSLAVLLLLAVIAGAAGIAWQAVLARQAAQRATREAQRAEREATRERATKEFLISVFAASDPRLASNRPRGTMTAKELLDASASRIQTEFKDDPQTQIELLSTAATIYYEFRDWPRYRQLHRQALEIARRQLGELHPLVINSLLDEIEDDNENADVAAATAGLERVAALIRRAGFTATDMQARWLLEQGRVLESNPAALQQRIAALRSAVDLFSKTAPRSNDYASALGGLGLAYSDADQFALAAQMHSKAIWLGEHVRATPDSDLGQEYSNLGLAYWYQGRYEEAERALAHASDLVLRTVGPLDSRYWESAVPYARVVHQRGDWRRAHSLFERIVAGLPRDSSAVHNAREVTAAAYVREVYATCLAIEGRAVDAIPMLEDVLRVYSHASSVEYDVRRSRLALGDAYERAGRLADARSAIQGARNDYLTNDLTDGMATLRARERWGRHLLRAGELSDAEQEFKAVIALDRRRHLEPAARALAGLAEIARQHHDAAAALDWSRQALAEIDVVTGMRDARTRPALQLVRARALLLSGDGSGAQTLGRDAAAALRRFDDPSSPDIGEADAVARAAEALR